MSEFILPETCLQMLGKASDAVLARQFGVSKSSIRSARLSRNIPSFAPYRVPIDWTDSMLMMLGTASDRTVGKALGLDETTVRIKRVRQGLPAFFDRRRTFHKIAWTKSMLKLLGKAVDRVVAQRLGIGILAVSNKRNALNIPPKGPDRRALEWTMEMRRDILTMRPSEFQKKHGVSTTAARSKQRALGVKPFEPLPHPRWMTFSPRMIALLGTQSDRALARKFHCSVITIRNRRKRLGIPTFTGRVSYRWNDASIRLLGTLPDAKLAAKLGIGEAVVQVKRSSLRIEPFRKLTKVEWSPAMQQVVGTMSDRMAAEVLGLRKQDVTYMRVKMGVQAHSWRPTQWSAEMISALGTTPDARLARQWGVKSSVVRKKRRSLGIPRCCRKGLKK